MKKIVILYPAHYEQSYGGAEIQIKYFMSVCQANGYEIHYIYEEKGKTINNFENIILHPIKKKNKIKFCGKGWFLYKRQINSILNEIKPDVIYTRLGSSWIYFAARYAKNNNIKHIHALASDLDVQKSSLQSLYPFFSPIENYYIERGLKLATKVITQNKFQQEFLYEKYNKLGVRVNQMTELFDASGVVKNDDILIIVWIANLKQVKQPELFVELAKSLKPYADKIKMIMCGRFAVGYERLLNEIEGIDYLDYVGELKQGEVFELLEKSDVLVNTSIAEGFSNTFVQAWMRKNIVLSLNSNPDDILTNYNVGDLLPTIDLMRNKIINLLDKKEFLRQMQQEAYDYVVENHSIDGCMPKVIKLL